MNTGPFTRFIPRWVRPRSLMGQMLLAMAAALLLVQSAGALLVYRAQRENYEIGMINAAAFRLMSESRDGHLHGRLASRRSDSSYDMRSGEARLENSRAEARRDHRIGNSELRSTAGMGQLSGAQPRGFALEFSTTSPARARERTDTRGQERLEKIFSEQEIAIQGIVVVHRKVREDQLAVTSLVKRTQRGHLTHEEAKSRLDDNLLVVGVQPQGSTDWVIARVRSPLAANILVQPLIIQTIFLYLALVGVMALILRRITRPLAALTRRVEQFAESPGSVGQLDPSGPEDMQRLIIAHNAMEARIVAMLDEKDVMLGAIGHDLKTPLAALRVRIESVENETERGRMADTIEDIVRTLDDILSLARVGRPSDPRERNELSALVASVVEEYEDMGDPVELGDTQRIALELRSTWLRRALRNLLDNALRYGGDALVTVHREEQKAVILIHDNGPGIPDDRIESMMDAFTRGDPSRNSTTGGSGLGLALARAIADQHGGALKLSNRRSPSGEIEGLTARLEIPIG